MGGGLSGSDRVTITWADSAIKDRYLEVGVRVSAATGLTAGPYSVDPDGPGVGTAVAVGDVFFFGNAVGNTGAGDTSVNSLVTATDEAGIRANPAPLLSNIPITNIYDVGRNASVSALDESAARLNGTNIATTLKYLNLTTAPAAPEADVFAGDEYVAIPDDAAIASALTSTTTTSGEISVPKWISNRIDSIDLNSGAPARLFQYLHDTNSPRSRALLQKFDAVADSLGLDDELLDELLADLK
jgi:hypothetical protein